MLVTDESTTSDNVRRYLEPYKSRELVEIQCSYCKKPYTTKKHNIQIKMSGYDNRSDKFKSLLLFCGKACSSKHFHESNGRGKKESECTQCGIAIEKSTAELKRSVNVFCSRSCATKYNNSNKSHGNRRSRLEKWLEEELGDIVPTLPMKFNSKEEIGSELDIYFPSLKLAIELNGIFHYEPIYGEEKLKSIKSNDKRKFQACLESGIELCIIDTSSLTYFKDNHARKYLDIITSILAAKGVSIQTHVEGC